MNEKLKELTAKLPSLEDLIVERSERLEYSSKSGAPYHAFGIYRDSSIAVVRCFAQSGSEMTMHEHTNEVEWIGVISGRAQVVLDDTNDRVILAPTEATRIDPGRPHHAIALEDTWFWCITMPPAAGFPSVSGSRAPQRLTEFILPPSVKEVDRP